MPMRAQLKHIDALFTAHVEHFVERLDQNF
jgi:hypothetical protein